MEWNAYITRDTIIIFLRQCHFSSNQTDEGHIERVRIKFDWLSLRTESELKLIFFSSWVFVFIVFKVATTYRRCCGQIAHIAVVCTWWRQKFAEMPVLEFRHYLDEPFQQSGSNLSLSKCESMWAGQNRERVCHKEKIYRPPEIRTDTSSALGRCATMATALNITHDIGLFFISGASAYSTLDLILAKSNFSTHGSTLSLRSSRHGKRAKMSWALMMRFQHFDIHMLFASAEIFCYNPHESISASCERNYSGANDVEILYIDVVRPSHMHWALQICYLLFVIRCEYDAFGCQITSHLIRWALSIRHKIELHDNTIDCELWGRFSITKKSQICSGHSSFSRTVHGTRNAYRIENIVLMTWVRID